MPSDFKFVLSNVLAITISVCCFAGLSPAQSSDSRAKTMLTAEFVFQPSVFTGDEFPRSEFLKPGEAHVLLGDYGQLYLVG